MPLTIKAARISSGVPLGCDCARQYSFLFGMDLKSLVTQSGLRWHLDDFVVTTPESEAATVPHFPGPKIFSSCRSNSSPRAFVETTFPSRSTRNAAGIVDTAYLTAIGCCHPFCFFDAASKS